MKSHGAAPAADTTTTVRLTGTGFAAPKSDEKADVPLEMPPETKKDQETKKCEAADDARDLKHKVLVTGKFKGTQFADMMDGRRDRARYVQWCLSHSSSITNENLLDFVTFCEREQKNKIRK